MFEDLVFLFFVFLEVLVRDTVECPSAGSQLMCLIVMVCLPLYTLCYIGEVR